MVEVTEENIDELVENDFLLKLDAHLFAQEARDHYKSELPCELKLEECFFCQYAEDMGWHNENTTLFLGTGEQ